MGPARASQYFIHRQIGEGGMSVVYVASDAHGNQVAVKRLKDEFASDPEFVKRFLQEAEIMGTLRHPHLAQAIDYVAAHGEFLLVEEFLSGGSLADRIGRGPILQQQALLWCRDALLGVDCAHQKGILHRDLKPGNLMFDAHGNIKVTDFGIAKVFGGPKLTRTRSEMGTPAYMSPEQIRTPQEAYHLTDVYSMGVVLYELLTRRVPFERSGDFDTKQAVVKETPPPPRLYNAEIPRDLERIVLKALEKDPNSRFGGCAEFAAQIDAYLQGRPFPSGGASWIRNHPRLTVVLVAGAVLIVLLMILSSAVRAAPGPRSATAKPITRPAFAPPHRETSPGETR